MITMKKRPISKSRKLFRTPNRSHDTRTRKVSCHDLGWLEDDQSTSDLVVVWVTWKQFSKIFLRKEYEERILTRFGLTNAQRYARVTRYSFAALNNVEESSVNMQTYLVKANRFSLLWSYDKTLGRTRSVFMGDHWYEGLLQNVLDCFRGPAVHHPMYLAEGASMVLAIYCEKWISLAEHNIRPIEERTGFGGSFVSVSAAEKALGKLSAQMSGVKSELTAVEATLRFNKRLSRFIAECLQSATHCPVTEPRLAAFKLGKNALMASCKATKDRLDCDHERLEEYVKRAETQLTAVCLCPDTAAAIES